MMKSVRIWLMVTLFLMAGATYAFDFSAVGDEPAVLYDTPSYNGAKLFIAPAHMPIEALFTYQGWTKIRDASGEMAWIETKALGQKRYVIVISDLVRIHEAPDLTSKVVFQARKNVLLEKLESTETGWVKVSHRDGESGYVQISELWGV